MIQHPEITWIEETGYPSWMQGDDEMTEEEYLDQKMREQYAYYDYLEMLSERERDER